MKGTIILIIIICNITGLAWGQDVFTIIDSVNTKFNTNTTSFSYDVRVENIKDSLSVILDEGHVTVNNTLGKYDDFLFISYHKKDTFCFVKDTLLWTRGDEILKDHTPKTLHVRLGTSKMFFRSFSTSFRNETKLINPDKWDEMILDSIDSEFYYLTLHGTLTALDIFHKIKVNVLIDRKSFHISKYCDQIESSRGDLVKSAFIFSNWVSSAKINEDVNYTFEKMRQRSNNPEYLSKHPTRKMRLDHNKTLSLDDLSITDSLDSNHKLEDIDKRYIVLYFWFQGCYHCRHVGPVIQKYHQMNGREDIAYLGVDTMSKDKNTLQKAMMRNQYDFPNYRYNGGVEGLTVSVAPLVILYDNLENKILEQIAGGSEDYEERFSKIIDGLPVY